MLETDVPTPPPSTPETPAETEQIETHVLDRCQRGAMVQPINNHGPNAKTEPIAYLAYLVSKTQSTPTPN